MHATMKATTYYQGRLAPNTPINDIFTQGRLTHPSEGTMLS